jgi:hypothetical protein
MKIKVFVFLPFISFAILFGQQKLDYKQLISDYDKFIEILENTHPDPFTPFGGRMQFHKQVLKTKENILQEGMTNSDYHFLLSSFISKLHDGHTYITYPDVSKQIDDNKMLPIKFRIASDGMLVIKTTPEWSFLIGRKLISVNGFGNDALLNLAQQYEPCENISGAYFVLNKFLNTQDQAKQIFRDMNESLKFTFSNVDNKLEDYVITYVSDKTETNWIPFKRWDKMEQEKVSPLWFNFIDEEKKICYFAFNTTYAREVGELTRKWGGDVQAQLKILFNIFKPGKMPEDEEEALNKIPSLNETFFNLLSEMKNNKSTHLIIDLRKNGGGWTPIIIPALYMLAGDKYFDYKCNAEYNTLISDLYLKKQNITLEQYNSNRNTSLGIGDYNFGYFMGNNWPSDMSLKERRNKYLKDNVNSKIGDVLLKNQDGNPVYSPKIIVVTSASTFSAAFHFAFFLKEITNATIVGIAPRQAYNSGMETTNFTLPNSQLSGSVSNSYQLFMPDNLEKGKIFIPDYEMSCSIFADYGYDQDAEIKYITDLIKINKL